MATALFIVRAWMATLFGSGANAEKLPPLVWLALLEAAQPGVGLGTVEVPLTVELNWPRVPPSKVSVKRFCKPQGVDVGVAVIEGVKVLVGVCVLLGVEVIVGV